MNTFKKEERLHSRSIIKDLFEKGKAINTFPIRTVFKIIPERPNPTVQAAFSVSKKKFKKAVDRNLIKRRMREAYRTNKTLLKDHFAAEGSDCYIMFIYTGSELVEYVEIRDKIILTLQRILKKDGQTAN
jgi:ribonuclease P protein component